MSMASEFKEFVNKGNVMDLAVGVIIGAIFGGLDFSAKYVVLGGADKVTAGMPLAAAKAAGANVLAWGDLVSVIFNFVILAFVIFQLVKFANRMNPPAAAPAGPSEVELLTEIRDSLKK